MAGRPQALPPTLLGIAQDWFIGYWDEGSWVNSSDDDSPFGNNLPATHWQPLDGSARIMLALLGPLIGIVTSLLGGISGGVLTVLESLAGSLGIRFYLGLTVGLIITDNKVRDVAISLGKAVVGAVI